MINWTTVIWTGSAAICLTLAGLYFSVWIRQRYNWAFLLFSFTAISAAALAMLELNLLHAPTPSAYGEILRWMHVPAAAMIIWMVWFLHIYLRAGRRSLAWIITGLRLLILLPNFLFYPNATFAEISEIHHVVFLGETFSIPMGEINPWRVVVKVGGLLFMWFVIEAGVTAWKHGDRRRAMTVCGATLLTAVFSSISSDLMISGVLPGTFSSLCFLLFVVVMAYELSLDISHASKLSAELEESRQRMELACRAAKLEMWEWDVLNDEIWATRATDRLMGFDVSKPIKLDQFLNAVHQDDQEVIRETIFHTMQENEELQLVFRIVNQDDQVRWLSVSGKVEYGPSGQPRLIRGISQDITEVKAAEAKVQEHRDELAYISRISSLGLLSSALAHEINQPLGAILRDTEVAELLLKQRPSNLDELGAIVKDIRADSQRAITVISRMRSLLQRHELKFEALAVAELIEQVSQILRGELRTRRTKLLVEIPKQLTPVYGDSIHLQQVILNLLLNSMDALDESAVENRTIFIRASRTADRMIEIVISDNGPGVDPEKLPLLFDPFFTAKKDGLGIGLAISKTIVETHGGKIKAEKSSYGGVEVRFTLQTVRASETPA
jgi:PAS domain S-box-containing protein